MADYFPTRFDSAAVEIVDILARETYTAANGDTEAPCGAFYRVSFTPVEASSAIADDTDTLNLSITYGVSAQDITGHWVGVEDSHGFVKLTRYDTDQEASDAYDALEADYATWFVIGDAMVTASDADAPREALVFWHTGRNAMEAEHHGRTFRYEWHVMGGSALYYRLTILEDGKAYPLGITRNGEDEAQAMLERAAHAISD